ncbi:MAG: ABC transporter ATP-binding protein [Treponema sp.]|jgi:zinc transport system ATP-binding protein|nr:ABC transporter ATP-binding protein [Treponema sp.]
MALITCQGLSFAYEGNRVVWDLNFTVEMGDYLCIIGENGSGKSTLILGLLGLKAPQGGQMAIEGFKSHEVGYLPQYKAAEKDFPAGVYEVVLSGRLGKRGLRPFYSREDKRIAMENLERLDIAGLRNRCYRELSGGQRQRVLLARALCAADRLLVLDEPAAGLDPLVTAEFYQLLEGINRKEGLTIIMVSHDVPMAVKYANHILHLRGKQLFFGTVPEYTHSNIGKEFLGKNREEHGD